MVDFKPAHMLTPGSAPNPFPPKAFQPGSVGDKDYNSTCSHRECWKPYL